MKKMYLSLYNLIKTIDWCKLGFHEWEVIEYHQSFFGGIGQKMCLNCGKTKEISDVV